MRKTLLPLLIGFSATPLAALAQFGGSTTGGTTTGGTTTGGPPTVIPTSTITSTSAFWQLLCTGVLWFFGIVIIIAFVMLLVAAVTFMTAGGNEEKVNQARSMLTYGIIGIAVALLARAILQVVASLFGIDFGGLFGC